MKPLVRETHPQYNETRPVDYTKGKHDPSRYGKEQQRDVYFWMNFHADWYASVSLYKSHPTTKIKSINWDYLLEIDFPVVRVEDAFRRMNVSSFMSFNYDWNERSWLSSMLQLFMSTAQPIPSTGPYKGSPFQLSMHSLQAFFGSLMLIS
jgi:hypothetical protein